MSTTSTSASGSVSRSVSTDASADALAVLRRIRTDRPPVAPGEACEMCGTPIPPDDETLLPRTSGDLAHSHVVDVAGRRLLCTCRACALLFVADGAALAYRTVPDRYLTVPPPPADPARRGDLADPWESLQVPVGLAFVFLDSRSGRPAAFYPSPAGATESQLPLEAWDDVVAAYPTLEDLRSDVEAVLVRGAGGPDVRCYLVPIDACYALVGRLRRVWRGFDGGSDARALLRDFFAEIERVSRPAPDPAGSPR